MKHTSNSLAVPTIIDRMKPLFFGRGVFIPLYLQTTKTLASDWLHVLKTYECSTASHCVPYLLEKCIFRYEWTYTFNKYISVFCLPKSGRKKNWNSNMIVRSAYHSLFMTESIVIYFDRFIERFCFQNNSQNPRRCPQLLSLHFWPRTSKSYVMK